MATLNILIAKARYIEARKSRYKDARHVLRLRGKDGQEQQKEYPVDNLLQAMQSERQENTSASLSTTYGTMKIYLDNCCLNRPFDDQSNLRVRLEPEAVNHGQWDYVQEWQRVHEVR